MQHFFACVFLLICLLASALAGQSPWKPCRGTGVETNYERREISVSQMPFVGFLWYLTKDRDRRPIGNDRNHAAVTIIDRNIVLTTAQICETSPKANMMVHVGKTYVEPPGMGYAVIEYVNHPHRVEKYQYRVWDEAQTLKHYLYKYIAYNLCLLRLTKDLTWSPYVQRAPLPYPTERLRNDSQLFIAGWSHMFSDEYQAGACIGICGGHGKKELKRASLFYHVAKEYPSAECDKQISNENSGWIDKGSFCVDYACKSYHTTYGDDGAPVYDMISHKVVGIVTNVREFDEKPAPQPCNRLDYAVPWINEVREKWTKGQKPTNENEDDNDVLE